MDNSSEAKQAKHADQIVQYLQKEQNTRISVKEQIKSRTIVPSSGKTVTLMRDFFQGHGAGPGMMGYGGHGHAKHGKKWKKQQKKWRKKGHKHHW